MRSVAAAMRPLAYAVTAQASRVNAPYSHLRAAGESPILLEAVTGQIELRSTRAEQLKAWRLDIVGKRLGSVPLAKRPDGVTLTMLADRQAVYYELAVE